MHQAIHKRPLVCQKEAEKKGQEVPWRQIAAKPTIGRGVCRKKDNTFFPGLLIIFGTTTIPFTKAKARLR
jgi:hypothetical protein